MDTKDLTIDELDSFLHYEFEQARERAESAGTMFRLYQAHGAPDNLGGEPLVAVSLLNQVAQHQGSQATLCGAAATVEVLGRILTMQSDTLDVLRALLRKDKP